MALEAIPKGFGPFYSGILNAMEAITDKAYISPLRMIVSKKYRAKFFNTSVGRSLGERMIHAAFGKIYPSKDRAMEKALRALQPTSQRFEVKIQGKTPKKRFEVTIPE